MTPRTIEAYEWRWVYITGGLLLIVLSLPFLWAYATAVPDRIFMGILVNPIDGMSYQAKMLQGYNGSWLFELPYTPEPHTGVFVYTFYVGLGHLARLLNVEPILVFHVVRLVGGMFMFCRPAPRARSRAPRRPAPGASRQRAPRPAARV